MSWRIEHGDCVEVMARMAEASVDAVITDGPYGLEFMGRAWDTFGTPLAFQQWCESWAREALRVLKPGGQLLSFGGTRTYHRMASGVEDAGFEARDLLAWLHGEGWPKNELTQLKPALEPIMLARKPLVGTVSANVLAHGTGALNIDACRIEYAFCGSGTTGIAALVEGFHFVGIEREAQYVELARRRIVGDNPLFNRNGG